jgi:CHAT domain-containing protein/tetratricopeptide (TPR) repeat protein
MLRLLSIAVSIAVASGQAGDEPNAQSPLPQYKRLLRGEDARRVAEWSARASEAAISLRFDEAIDLTNQALVLRTQVQGADHWEAANEKWFIDGVRRLAASEREQQERWQKAMNAVPEAQRLETGGQHAKAEPIWREYRECCELVFGERHFATAISLNNLGANLLGQGNYFEAERFCRSAATISLDLIGDEHPETATAHHNLARSINAQGRAAEAYAIYQKSLNMRLAILGETHPLTAQSYNSLAFNLEAQGRFADAYPLFEKALTLRRGLHGDLDQRTATSYNCLASNLGFQGKVAEAQPLFEKYLEINRELLGEMHPDTATAYNNLGLNLNEQGKYVESQPLLQRALELRIKLLGDHPETAASYSNLGLNLNDQLVFSDAQQLLEKAVEMSLKLFGDNHFDTARNYNNLAINLTAQGKHSEAEPLLQKALDLNRKLVGNKALQTANTLTNKAANSQRLGRHADAQQLLEEALELAREFLGEQHPNTVRIYNHIAVSLRAQQRYDDARSILEKAAATYEAARLTLADRGLDRAAFGAEHSPYRTSAAIHARLGSSREAWTAIETDLARGLSDESATRRGTALRDDEQQLRKELAGRLSQIQTLILPLLTLQQPTDAQNVELAKLQAERRVLEGRIAQLAITLSQREIAPLADVQAAIPTDAALILWADTGSPVAPEQWGCVIRRTGDPSWERLHGTGPDSEWTADDEQIANRLHDALASRADSTADISTLAKALYELRIAPLVKYLNGATTLYVVPVGAMADVPVEVLAQEYTISYVPSGTYLAKLQKRDPASASGLLALGDPIFSRPDAAPKASPELPPGGLLIRQIAPGGAAAKAQLKPGDVLVRYGETELNSHVNLTDAIAAHAGASHVPISIWRQGATNPLRYSVAPGRLGVFLDQEPAPLAIANRHRSDSMLRSVRDGSWGELPGTRSEVNQIARLFDGRATVLLDSEASEQSLEKLRRDGHLAEFRYVHMATHGQGNNTRSLHSSLILSQDSLPKELIPQASQPFIDGRLSASEVLDFWTLNADLVTLSACETALGRKGGGDGLLGFAQAFALSGSRAVCLSLWKVDDAATALLMPRFYQNLLGSRPGLDRPMPKAAALAEAKRWLRELTEPEATGLLAVANNAVVRGDRGKNEQLKLAAGPARPAAVGQRPFADPRYWAAFVLFGDPN